MQIILVSRHLKAARTIAIMPRHLLAALGVFVALVLASALLLSWISVRAHLPLVDDLLSSMQERESRRSEDYLSNNLQLMARRIGELQARVMQLDSLGEHLSDLAGVKPPVPGKNAGKRSGQGGPYMPAPLNAEVLEAEVARLSSVVESKADDLRVLESRLLEKRVRDRLLPTTLPVKDVIYGSPFGFREDPIAGSRAMHEGIDFRGEPGTPVVVAADGVVLSAAYHPEFGNLVEVDHGDGLVSRYAHLSRMDVQAGRLVKRGELVGAIDTTGRSTGPHLHFEVRMFGIAQNPALFLKQGAEFAQLKRR